MDNLNGIRIDGTNFYIVTINLLRKRVANIGVFLQIYFTRRKSYCVAVVLAKLDFDNMLVS